MWRTRCRFTCVCIHGCASSRVYKLCKTSRFHNWLFYTELHCHRVYKLCKTSRFHNWLFYTELHCHRVYKLCKTSGSRFHNWLFYSELHTVSFWINRICVLSLSIRPQLGGDSGESVGQYQLQAWASPDLWAGHHPWTSLDDSPPGVVQLYTMQQERGGSATVVSTVPGMHKLTVPGMDNGCHRNVIWHICIYIYSLWICTDCLMCRCVTCPR